MLAASVRSTYQWEYRQARAIVALHVFDCFNAAPEVRDGPLQLTCQRFRAPGESPEAVEIQLNTWTRLKRSGSRTDRDGWSRAQPEYFVARSEPIACGIQCGSAVWEARTWSRRLSVPVSRVSDQSSALCACLLQTALVADADDAGQWLARGSRALLNPRQLVAAAKHEGLLAAP
jgi:hypothetical protein